MLSNRIWNMPTADRSASPGAATVYFRCGSQQGKPARTLPSDVDQGEFDRLTVEFLQGEIATYAKARGKQKNAARNLKKYLDADAIQAIEGRGGDLSAEDLAALLR